MDNGWIKLHRKLLDNPLMSRPAYRSVWIEILLRATHNGADVLFKGSRIKLQPGQLTTGAYQISEATGVPRGTVERILKTFKSEGQIEIESDRQCSMITVLKWSSYQGGEEPNEERPRNDRGTSEERVRTKQESNNEKNERMKEPDQILATTKVVAEKNEVNEILSVFQMKLNPTINYGNKTQRDAVSDMLKLMGKERILKMVEYAASVSSDQFAPVITTPYQLKEKMAQLANYQQKQSKCTKQGYSEAQEEHFRNFGFYPTN